MHLLVGVGTHLAGDDAVGLRVSEELATRGLPQVEVLHLAGSAIDLLHHLDDVEDVLVVDACRMGLSPGEFAFFDRSQAHGGSPGTVASTHGGDVVSALALAETLGLRVPPVRFLGIEPAVVAPGVGLSPVLVGRLDEYVAAAAARLTAAGD